MKNEAQKLTNKWWKSAPPNLISKHFNFPVNPDSGLTLTLSLSLSLVTRERDRASARTVCSVFVCCWVKGYWKEITPCVLFWHVGSCLRASEEPGTWRLWVVSCHLFFFPFFPPVLTPDESPVVCLVSIPHPDGRGVNTACLLLSLLFLSSSQHSQYSPVSCTSTAATPLIFFCKFACFSLCKQTLVVLRSLAS